jgi:isopenicillin N synthase-like dioxygenase|tara:strand:- start:730 stop:1662 length:933 start_codon:yes stop_codon:yes gene_type:complete
MSAPFAIISLEKQKKDAKQFAQELGESFLQCGFCGISEHTLDLDLIDDVMIIFKEFFALPHATKKQYFDPKVKGARGYTPTRIETPKDSNHADYKEFWHVGRELESHHPLSQWMHKNLDVKEIEKFNKKTNALYDQFDKLGQSLLSAIAIFLKLDATYFITHAGAGNSIMRAIHYPPIELKEEAQRAGAHEDINLITLLIGGHQSGLELLTKQGKWEKIQVERNIIICNIGDMLQRFTNHYLPSTTHRVSASMMEAKISRYSIPFFVHPNSDWRIKTLADCITNQNPNRYSESILAEDFLASRLREINLA